MAWESPEAGEGKGPGGDRADIFEEVTGEPLEEGFTQVSRGQKGGGWSPPGREASMGKSMEEALKANLCFWGANSRKGV